MEKLLIVSFNGLSETTANGKTLQAMLSNYKAENLVQFYRGSEMPDLSFAESYFHVTDKEMLKSFCGYRPAGVYDDLGISKEARRIPIMRTKSPALSSRLRKHNYNFFLRWIREFLWEIAPWGKRRFRKWIDQQNPQAIVYMVGESLFEDRLVKKIAQKRNLPVVLYNCEGYRLVEPRERRGLERLFYKKLENSYDTLQKMSNLVIYNCEYLRKRYQDRYTAPQNELVAFNSAPFDTTGYQTNTAHELSIVYFGNLGVGRVPSLLQVADEVHRLCPDQKIDVYGIPTHEDSEKLDKHPAITLHGFVNQETLRAVRQNADVLLHVESFDSMIMPKLTYAFSTKIAQCLCSGRAVLTYAPANMASTEYLLAEDCVAVARNQDEMREKIYKLLTSVEYRQELSRKALATAKENHDLEKTAKKIRTTIGATCES